MHLQIKMQIISMHISISIYTYIWQRKNMVLTVKTVFHDTCYSVTKPCLIIWDPMVCSMTGFPALHYVLEFAQIYVHWVVDTIYPSLLLCLQSFPASGSFPVSWLFASGGQTTGVSASVLPVNIQGLFPLGLTGLISLQSKGLSRVFSNTTVQKQQFFSAPLSLWSNSHIPSWPLEKP